MKVEVSEKGCRSINGTNQKSLVYRRLAKPWQSIGKLWKLINFYQLLTTALSFGTIFPQQSLRVRV